MLIVFESSRKIPGKPIPTIFLCPWCASDSKDGERLGGLVLTFACKDLRSPCWVGRLTNDPGRISHQVSDKFGIRSTLRIQDSDLFS